MRKLLPLFGIGILVIAGCAKQEPAAVSPPIPATVSVKSEVPLFDLPTPTGEKIALKELLDKHKAILINFWFHG